MRSYAFIPVSRALLVAGLLLCSPVVLAQDDPDAQLERCSRKQAALKDQVSELSEDVKKVQAKFEDAQKHAAELQSQLSEKDAQAKAADALKEELDAAKRMLEAAQRDSSTSESLQKDLAAAHAKLQEAQAEHAQAASKLKEDNDAAEKKLKQMQADMKNADARMKELRETEDKIETLNEELDEAREMVRIAQETWLPLWSHEHYERHVQPVVRLYNEEVASGRVLQRSASAATEAYRATHKAVAPTASEAYRIASENLAPVYDVAAQRAKAAHISIAEELSKPVYKPYVDQWKFLNGKIATNWQVAVKQVDAASRHPHIQGAKRWVREQVQRVEQDLQRIFTNLLKADVPGSGISPEDIRRLVRGVLLGVPGMALFVLLLQGCCGRRRATPAATATSSGSRGSRARPSKKAKKATSSSTSK